MCSVICFTLLLFYINSIFANITIQFDKQSAKDSITNCAVKIANENFNLRRLTVVVLANKLETNIVNNFLNAYKGTVIIETKKDGPPPRQVVVIVESFKSFMNILGKLKPDLTGKSLLSSGAKFLIILLENSKKIERITEILWGYHATNAVIIAVIRGKVNILTYFPYKDHFNCHNTDPVVIGDCTERSQEKIFPEKMANMRGCPLYISTNKLYHQASEQKNALQVTKKTIVKLLRDTMHFTPIISKRDYVSIDSDRAKNWSDSLNDVITGLANISTCSIPLGVDRFGLLAYSFPYFRVRLAWLAPPVTTGPVWWRLLSPLNGYLWLILLLVIFFVTSLPFALKLSSVKKFCYRYLKDVDKLHGVAIRTWGVMLGQPIRVAPRRFRDLYIISLWMWFTFVVRNAYQSVLIGALKTDTMIGNFGELKEAIESGYRFGGRAGVLTHFEHDPAIRDDFQIIADDKFESVFRDVIEGKEKFVIATSLEYAWAYCLAQDKKDEECGHVLLDSIMTVPLVIWTKVYSPFVEPLAIWLPRLMESGLLERDSIKKPRCCTLRTMDPTPLTRHQTLSCFICLLLGYSMSITVFILEILRHKTKKVKHGFVQTRENKKARLSYIN